ncbi:uncharacterized protein LOC125749313 isoform X3 [Brienomyrus brachyistius]|nr:uncharacterized protein LOC125749313 isoform X3 [Brienomyrus brachyistius]
MDSPSTVKWTSESIGKPVITFTLHGRSAAKKPKDGKMLSNGSIYLSDVDSSDAGNYSCWVQRGPCHWIRLLTVNLYVRSGSLVENVNHGGLGQTTESWNQDAHEPQDKKDSSHKMVVISATLVTSLLALLLLCMVLHCRCRRSAEITSPNEQLHPEPSHRSTESSRSEMNETEYHVYSVLNVTKPEEYCVIESQDTCVYSLIKTTPACTSGN